MPEVWTHVLTPESLGDAFVTHQTYCGLDSMLTLEVWAKVRETYGEPRIYSFSRALQAPYLDIMRRGFLVNETGRRAAIEELRGRIGRLERQLDVLARAIWGKGLNPRSPKQLQEFFYRQLRVPEVWISQKGVRKLSTNREALEKIEQYLHPQIFVSHILRIRELGKQLSVFEAEIDSDRRIRPSYNIAGTETGRPSSSENAFGTGTNMQNIAGGLRWVFEADPGKKLAVVDLEQVEARDVGFICGVLFDDWTFLDACESGDLHTNNAKRIWPELGWGKTLGDDGKLLSDRAIAERLFYRDFTYRDMAKRGSHLSNYMGTAWTAARSLKVPIGIMEEFQARYCRGDRCAFPAINRYWAWVATQLQEHGRLVTPFGRERHFFGRPEDDTTLREAIAFLPQSTTADRMNLGMWRVWYEMPEVELLAQTYDSITFQYSDAGAEAEAKVLRRVLELIRVELIAPNGRSYVVPGEAKIGWNWGAKITEAEREKARTSGAPPHRIPRLNPDGLQKWNPKVPDLRVRRTGLSRLIV